jgi:hypothetical protein
VQYAIASGRTAKILQGLFSAELLSGLRVIDGDKDPEGGPDAA